MKYPGTGGPTLAEQWRSKSREMRRGRAVPLLLTKGITIKIARPPIETWFGTAKLPESLSKIVIEVFSSTTVEEMEAKVSDRTDEENALLVKFFNRLILEGVIEPVIVDKDETELEEGEMALADLDEQDRAEIQYAIMAGVPLQPVETASGGEVSMETLSTFRDEQ